MLPWDSINGGMAEMAETVEMAEMVEFQLAMLMLYSPV